MKNGKSEPDPEAEWAQWDQVSEGWWHRVAGPFEIHVRADEDLGWEISVNENGQSKTRPTFRKNFVSAAILGQRLFEHYAHKNHAEVIQ